jgi:hypothetical protein
LIQRGVELVIDSIHFTVAGSTYTARVLKDCSLRVWETVVLRILVSLCLRNADVVADYFKNYVDRVRKAALYRAYYANVIRPMKNHLRQLRKKPHPDFTQ